jgi:hypothetical protein
VGVSARSAIYRDSLLLPEAGYLIFVSAFTVLRRLLWYRGGSRVPHPQSQSGLWTFPSCTPYNPSPGSPLDDALAHRTGLPRAQLTPAGICGSDLHNYLAGGVGGRPVTEPIVMGHESAGEVIAVGELVTTHKVGDRVAGESQRVEFESGSKSELDR